jgi:hypothetical protein
MKENALGEKIVARRKSGFSINKVSIAILLLHVCYSSFCLNFSFICFILHEIGA